MFSRSRRSHVLIEGLENRALMATVPLPVGDVRTRESLWTVDSHGGQPVKLLDNLGLFNKVVAFNGSVYVQADIKLYQTKGVPGDVVKIFGDNDTTTDLTEDRATLIGVVGDRLYYTVNHYDPREHAMMGSLRYIDASGSSGGVSGLSGSIGANIVNGELYVSATLHTPHSKKNYKLTANGLEESSGSTSPSTPVPPPATSVNIGDARIYAFDDGSSGNELWYEDSQGSRLVADIFAGAGSSSPTSMNVVGDRVVFEASEAYISNGSANVSGGVLFVAGSIGHENIVISSDSGLTTVTITNVYGTTQLLSLIHI